ncbi:sigma-54-dependent transcriptional regulator [Desulfococcus multivorans]|jgi:DNA-binding NtrC family response regulator|uniref:Putative two component, sigma54 specific, transcriptional regulator n=2 Tax=Desulfococcus TaxID=896 RepID=S7U0V5_DESML|nr:sigma-54 dependent transcriptional regulator [Desulfococcus multivorans]AQV01128.1 DNA-binding response regulator [Desulfococcus multivorans]EPR42967.1 putative two component, sigma54 specific, transcriptional regulator [Desulfococcus multivorans DSM 2059]MDX9818799.1 sigma-54 dependent transcriptional regulator [Desulfococcus multivorans]SJZ51473.1 regulatory protein, Fis family [Desulfococcus multivorans DSM 2059]
MTTRAILIVDDEPDMLVLLKRSLEPDLKCRVTLASSGTEALRHVSQGYFDLILADIKMPGMDGLALLEMVKRDYPEQTVVMMTGHGSIETAVEAMKHGAYDFITKPFDHDALVLRLEKALERSSLIRENLRLKKETRTSHVFQDLVGKSAVMQRVFETIRMVANTEFTVLITGESGTGKDLTARAIHALSARSEGPYVPVNCPTVPEHILESELFGYKKGAFTHATQNKIGLFQEADKGTLFLDEIGDVSPAIQTKLLRVIQEKEIKPLGDNRTISVDVRIISSTNQNLREKIREGTFREDFFYRLNVLPITLPPLRERREDIPLIADHILAKHCRKLSKPLKTLSPKLMELLVERPWEGNVRELENVIIQGILFSGGEEIQPRDIGIERLSGTGDCPEEETLLDLPYRDAKERNLQRFNNAYIGRLLAETGGNVTQAARKCGLERQSLQQIMRRYRILADRFR